MECIYIIYGHSNVTCIILIQHRAFLLSTLQTTMQKCNLTTAHHGHLTATWQCHVLGTAKLIAERDALQATGQCRTIKAETENMLIKSMLGTIANTSAESSFRKPP